MLLPTGFLRLFGSFRPSNGKAGRPVLKTCAQRKGVTVMQASGLSSPAPVTDKIRNPGAQPLPEQPNTTQPTASARQPVSVQQPDAAVNQSTQAALNNAQTLQQAGTTLQATLQGVGNAPPSQGTATPELGTPQPLPELPMEVELPTLDAMPRPDGNFQSFLQKLGDTPSFAEGFNQLLLSFNPSAGGEIPAELDALMQLLPKGESELAALVKSQLSGTSRFTGELFGQLREAYAQSPSKGAKSDILNFLRRFNDYTSAPRVARSMLRTLGQLARAVPREDSAALQPLTEQLAQHLESGDRAGALKLLQNKLLPFLTDFSDSHPDMRLPNTLISIFKPMASRYEGGSEEGLLQAFRQLSEHTALRPHFAHLSAGELLELVRDSEYARAAENDRFAAQLAETADWAMKGKGGGEPRKLFRQLVSNLLLNKSVYLPLEHAVIPLEWNGKRVVSELWLDPDADKGQNPESAKDRLLRFLLHMDIPGLGPFDLIFTSRGDEVDMQLACPASVVPFSERIHRELTRILEDNGLKMNAMQIKKWEKPLALTEAFPKIARGSTGVNIKL